MQSKHQGWVASLSDGSTIFETSSESWTILTNFCKEHNLKITQLRLQMCGTTIRLSRPTEIPDWWRHKGYVCFSETVLSERTLKPRDQRVLGIVLAHMGEPEKLFVNCLIMDASRNVWNEVRDYDEKMASIAYLRED